MRVSIYETVPGSPGVGRHAGVFDGIVAVVVALGERSFDDASAPHDQTYVTIGTDGQRTAAGRRSLKAHEPALVAR